MSDELSEQVSPQPLIKRIFNITLPTQVLLGLFLGILAGLFFGEMIAWIKVIGDIFIKLLQISLIPYISMSMITGLGSLRYDEVKKLVKYAGSTLLFIWFIAICIIVIMPLAFPLWPSSTFFNTSDVQTLVPPDFLQLFIPSNPFYSYANGIVPAILIFSILVGFSLIEMEKKDALIEPLMVFRDTMVKITGYISKLAPIGVFALISHTVGTINFDDLTRLQVYLVLFATVALLMGLWVLPALVSAVTPLRYTAIIKALRTPLITAFATGSALIVLPMLIERSKLLIENSEMWDSESVEHTNSALQVAVTTGYTFVSPGALLTLFFILFSGWYIGSDIAIDQYPVLIAIGLPSLFAGAYISIPFLLDLMKLPSDLFEVFVSLDLISLRFATMLSAMHYATIGLIASMGVVRRLRIKWLYLSGVLLSTIVFLALALFSIKSFYTHIVVAPYKKDEELKRSSFWSTPQPSTIHTQTLPNPRSKPKKLMNLAALEKRGSINVCFQPNEYPSSFYNNTPASELVGFDIEMAHIFARQFSLSIEFFPTETEQQAQVLLHKGTCDVYMRTLSINPSRTKELALTSPVYISSLGLIVRDHRRNEFQNWDEITERNEELKIGLNSSAGSLQFMRSLLPETNLYVIPDMKAQEKLLSSNMKDIDAIADMSEEGAVWTLLYPQYNLVIPRPVVSIPVAYAVASDNVELLEALDAWLIGEIHRGTVNTLYEYWMLGEAVNKDKPPRWSIIRDVLHWVD